MVPLPYGCQSPADTNITLRRPAPMCLAALGGAPVSGCPSSAPRPAALTVGPHISGGEAASPCSPPRCPSSSGPLTLPQSLIETEPLFKSLRSRVIFFPFRVKIKLEFFKSQSLISFWIFLVFPAAWARECMGIHHTHAHTHRRVHTQAQPARPGRWGGGPWVLSKGRVGEETWVQTSQKPLQNIWVCQSPKPPFARHGSG